MYYIHVPDPTFQGQVPFPFGRRLGPFLTEAEAVNQAVSDIAGGHGSYLGIYDEASSQALERPLEPGKKAPAPTVGQGELERLAGVERARRGSVGLDNSDLAAAWDVLESRAVGKTHVDAVRLLRAKSGF